MLRVISYRNMAELPLNVGKAWQLNNTLWDY